MNLQETTQALSELKNWSLNTNAISKNFEFTTFMEAINFVNNVAEIAEKHSHHPDMTIRYTNVTLSLTTHDEGATVTQKDIAVAKDIDTLSSSNL